MPVAAHNHARSRCTATSEQSCPCWYLLRRQLLHQISPCPFSPPCNVLARLLGRQLWGRRCRPCLFTPGVVGLPNEQGARTWGPADPQRLRHVSLCLPRRWGRRARVAPSWLPGPAEERRDPPAPGRQGRHRAAGALRIPGPPGCHPHGRAGRQACPQLAAPLSSPPPCRSPCAWQPRRPRQPVFQPCASFAGRHSGCGNLFTVRLISEL